MTMLPLSVVAFKSAVGWERVCEWRRANPTLFRTFHGRNGIFCAQTIIITWERGGWEDLELYIQEVVAEKSNPNLFILEHAIDLNRSYGNFSKYPCDCNEREIIPAVVLNIVDSQWLCVSVYSSLICSKRKNEEAACRKRTAVKMVWKSKPQAYLSKHICVKSLYLKTHHVGKIKKMRVSRRKCKWFTHALFHRTRPFVWHRHRQFAGLVRDICGSCKAVEQIFHGKITLIFKWHEIFMMKAFCLIYIAAFRHLPVFFFSGNCVHEWWNGGEIICISERTYFFSALKCLLRSRKPN